MSLLAHWLLLSGISVISLLVVWSMLRRPWHAAMHPVSVPEVLAPEDFTFDHRGLT